MVSIFTNRKRARAYRTLTTCIVEHLPYNRRRPILDKKKPACFHASFLVAKLII